MASTAETDDGSAVTKSVEIEENPPEEADSDGENKDHEVEMPKPILKESIGCGTEHAERKESFTCQQAVYLPAVLFNNCCLHKSPFDKTLPQKQQYVMISPVGQPSMCQFCQLCTPQLSSCLPNRCAHSTDSANNKHSTVSNTLCNALPSFSSMSKTIESFKTNIDSLPLGQLTCTDKNADPLNDKYDVSSVSTQTELCIPPSKVISFSDFESNEDIPGSIYWSAHRYQLYKNYVQNGYDSRKSICPGKNSEDNKNLQRSTSSDSKTLSNNNHGKCSASNSKETDDKSCNTYTYASEMKKEQKHSSPLLQHLQCHMPQSPTLSHRLQDGNSNKEIEKKPNEEPCDLNTVPNESDSAGDKESTLKISTEQKFNSFPRKSTSSTISQFNSLPHPHKNGLGDGCDSSSDQETFSPTRLDDWIHLNVGGEEFTTSRATLILEEPESMLAKMFGGHPSYLPPASQDSKGRYVIDRSSCYFAPLLNYLRSGALVLDPGINPEGVLQEARFYGLEGVIPKLEKLVAEQNTPPSDTPLTRHDVVKALLSTTHNSALRFQAVNLRGADLSWLDLRNINFKYADLRDAVLTGANLTGCNLERAKMSGACLEQAQLLNVRLVCADLQNADMRRCNFENPSGGDPPNCEGVNLRNSNLEGSMMAQVNLRVSTLKNAILRNCDLRMSILAGADMENCDLSGSNLMNANLRGANLKDASFELMQTPLHMSQTCNL